MRAILKAAWAYRKDPLVLFLTLQYAFLVWMLVALLQEAEMLTSLQAILGVISLYGVPWLLVFLLACWRDARKQKEKAQFTMGCP